MRSHTGGGGTRHPGRRSPFGGADAGDGGEERAHRKPRIRPNRAWMGQLAHKSGEEPLDSVESKMREHEMAIAREIQENLLPKQLPKVEGYDIGAYYRPSLEIGGDYYDFFQMDSENIGICVADVSGKGIPGSLVMTMARSLLRMEGMRNPSAADTLMKVNRYLTPDIKRGMFVTAMYVILNTVRRTLLVTSAGHNPMVLYRKASSTCHLVNPNGLALGIDRGPLFDKTIKEQLIQLHPGDRFVLHTDGVVESMNSKQEQLGEHRLYLLIKQYAEKGSNEFSNLIATVLENHKGDAQQHDDITMVTVRILPPGTATPSAAAVPSIPPPPPPPG
jgi:sigma-B regulation protein RsbU (phosphoserine phosphatase)